MQPQPLVPRDVGERVEVVDRAGHRRAGVGDDHERSQPGPAVGPDPLAECVRRQAERGVRADHADRARRETRHVGGLQDRVVDHVRRVHHPAGQVVAEPGVAGRDHGAKVGHRTPAGQVAPGLGREPDQVGEPPDDGRLQLDHGRCRGPIADVAVDGGDDQLGDRRLQQAAAPRVGEVAGSGRLEPGRQDVLEQLPQERQRGHPGPAAAARGVPRQCAPGAGDNWPAPTRARRRAPRCDGRPGLQVGGTGRRSTPTGMVGWSLSSRHPCTVSNRRNCTAVQPEAERGRLESEADPHEVVARRSR